jgi:hypothetical protein
MTSEKSFKPRKRANGQDLLRPSLSLEDQQIVPGTQTSVRNHSEGNQQRLFLGLLISGGLSASAQEQKAPRAILVATPHAQMQKAPRATLIATPNAQMQRPPRATLVATPTPTPAPVVVTKEDYDAIPVGRFYYFQGRLQQKMAWAKSPPSTASNVSETATPISQVAVVNTAHSSNTGPSSLLISTIDLLVLAGFLIGICIFRRASKTKSQGTNPPHGSKRAGRVYHNYDQFKAAMQRWDHSRQLFEQNEAARLEELKAQVEKAGPLSCLGCLTVIIAAVLVGAASGAGAGWGTVMCGVLVVYLLMTAEQRFRRWRNRAFFVRREFEEPEPVYQPPRQSDQPPPPGTEERQAPPRATGAARVTSMRQAYEILGLPPGRVTLEVARIAYRARMAEYHPDKVAHLGHELREVAARRALEINLAMRYVEEHTPSSGGAV